MIMFRNFKLSKPNFKYFSIIPKSKYIPNDKNSSILIKSGCITSLRLDSGQKVLIVRPKTMESLYINPEILEKMYMNIDLAKTSCQKDSSKISSDIIDEVFDPVRASVFDSMSQRIDKLTWKGLFEVYLKLGKIRLTTLVVVSAIAGSLMTPFPFDLNGILFSSLGTCCTSMAANTVNQILEIPYDSQMKRTKNRPLVLGKISVLHATMFTVFCATSGSILLYSCSPLSCILGLSNMFLYTVIYTPFKRIGIINTWLGSIVGALPPLIGWTAITGDIQLGGLFISCILFCWQFPHFMALSWNLKADYSKAGYQMASVVSPKLCKASALRHSILISALCPIAPIISLADWCFVIESLPFNLALCLLSYQFYSNPTSSNSRKLFRYTLIYLPILMTFLILNKIRN